MRVIRPIWGFGRWGWALLPVALGLTYCICGGFDLRFAVMQWWSDRFGWQSMLNTMIDWTIFPHAYALWTCVVNASTLIPVLLAMYLQPRSFPRWTWGMVVAGLLVNPLVWWNCHRLGMGVTRAVAHNAYLGLQLIGFAVFSAWLTRRLWVGVAALALGCGVEVMEGWLNWYVKGHGPADWINAAYYGGAWVWHLGVFATLVIPSAIAHRRAGREGWRCAMCGYDLRGLGAREVECPECGAAQIGAAS